MNKMKRLTALLLVLMMFVGTLAASAESYSAGGMSLSEWEALVDKIYHDLFDIHEGGSGKNIDPPKEDPLPSNPSKPYQNSNGYYLTQGRVSMSKSDIVTLTSHVNGQWQIQVGTLWVNLAGQTGSTLSVTYAMLANTNSVNYAVRQVDADGNEIGVVTFDVSEATLAERPQVTALSTETRGTSTYLSNQEANIATYAEGDVKKTYNIVINYIFENNEIVSDPYTASLAEGSSFSATVTFPTVQGYLPYVNDARQDSMALNYTSISDNVTINVVYKPTNVNYTVIHYQQNVDNDQYTIESTETKQGLTGSQVPEVAHVYTKTVDNVTTTVYNPDTDANKAAYTGFYSLLYERPAIAADGSTEIEVYYDRYYYLMNFDMDGGYGTEPVYARYGASIGEVTEPTRAGYTFKGWSETKGDTTAVTLPTTMPAESKTYYAIWTGDEKVAMTVVIWGENADDDDYTYMESKVILVDPNTGFSYDQTGDVVCAIEEHTHTDYTGSCYELTCTLTNHTHTDACLNCTHTHTTDCYKAGGLVGNDRGLTEKSKPTQDLTHIGNGIYTYTTTSGLGRENTHYYVNIGDKWYCSRGTFGNGTDDTNEITFNCSHTHTDACYNCGQTAHTHDASCYTKTCTKTEHTHSASCSTALPNMDNTKWVLNTEKSESTDKAEYDGSTVVNIYYDRKEYTINFYNQNGNTEYTDYRITAKWGEDIHEKWPTHEGSSTWGVDKDFSSNTYQAFIQTMPVGGDQFYGPKTSNVSESASYYVEILAGETASNTVTKGDVTYKLHHTDKTAGSGYNVTKEDRYDIHGFTLNKNDSTSIGSSYSGAKFYYTRNIYGLQFNNGERVIKTEKVQYQAALGKYDFTPTEVPSKYEPGSVEFAGWYLNPECTGEQYILANHTMPAGAENGDNALVLYAKWVPVTHTVKFYLTEKSESIYKPATADTEASFTVSHGDNIAEEYVKNHLEKSAMNAAKPNGDYTFVMWYYYENGDKKPFDPTTQIRKDLTLYGEWSTNVQKRYRIYYKIQNTDTEIAAPTNSSGLAGKSKTFDAKGDKELYADYQAGYFPLVQSHTLLLDIDNNVNIAEGEGTITEKDSDGNDVTILTYTFWYKQVDAVPYTVKYVDKDTGKSLADDKVVSDNRKAVVTETFKPISGYMPDAYQKRLVVSVKADGTPDTEKNTLYFYYSKDETHAYYKITHLTQNTDGATWTEYASSQAVGDIGTRYTGSPMTIPGFTYKEIKYVVNEEEVTDVTTEGAALTADGLEINLYYVRNEYPYQVRYLEQGSGNVLHDPKNGTGKYGEMVSESAIDIEGYDKVEPTSATLNIRIDEGEGAPKLNIITFYYKEQEVTINYVAVGPENATNFGSVDPTTETVKVKSGTAQGSTPTAGDGFKFVGWFKDEACEQPVDASWVTDNKIVPQKTDGKNVAATYYAKFEYDVSTLTITKNGMEDGDSAIFKVTVDGKVYTVVLNNTQKSVTLAGLKVGVNYSIEEDGDWSKWYDKVTMPDNATGTIKPPTEAVTVTITNTKSPDKWLHDESGVINDFSKKTQTEID